MPVAWNKFDRGLASIYSNYLAVQEHGAAKVEPKHPAVAEGGELQVSLQFSGDLAAIEPLGFSTVWQGELGHATGIVHLADLEAISAHPNVLKLSYGERVRRMLDLSVPDIGARPGVWNVDTSTGIFSGVTGDGILIGIVDTGIDFRHPFFFRDPAAHTTRILRIWDQGLSARSGEHGPNVSLLTGSAGRTYGVEYNDTMINAILQGASSATGAPRGIRHRDCDGHGTHVASIAAGDGRPDLHYIGVAPKADLIVVNYADPIALPAGINDDVMCKDAVTYIRKVAQSLSRPVVINCSLGNSLGPHDGLSDLEYWLTNEFSGTSGTFAGVDGHIFVTSAGNSSGTQQHARIDFPAGGGTTNIPFNLYDGRHGHTREFRGCQWQSDTEDLVIEFYYPASGPSLSARLDIPTSSGGVVSVNSPALNANPTTRWHRGRSFQIQHKDEPLIDAGVTLLHRNVLRITETPYRNSHITGHYVVAVTASDELTTHVWCYQCGRPAPNGQGFQVDNSSTIPLVAVEDWSTIGEFGGADNVITVGAYNAEVPAGTVADFSSAGPLVNYSTSGTRPSKPDLGAPGVEVDAANSQSVRPLTPGVTIPYSGTSMAAPHVTGVVALMLQSNTHLTFAQVRDALGDNVQPTTATRVAAHPNELGAGRLDAQDAFDNTP